VFLKEIIVWKLKYGKMKKRTNNKIQTLEMEKDIERTKDISEAWLEGGKAIGEIIRPKKKHSSHLK
jgi:hypothetical protein